MHSKDYVLRTRCVVESAKIFLSAAQDWGAGAIKIGEHCIKCRTLNCSNCDFSCHFLGGGGSPLRRVARLASPWNGEVVCRRVTASSKGGGDWGGRRNVQEGSRGHLGSPEV